jgi:hypothetical protein
MEKKKQQSAKKVFKEWTKQKDQEKKEGAP